MTADQHGRTSTYVRYRCRCLACTEAWRLSCWDQRIRRRQATEQNGGIAPVPQHNRSTYNNWACRCRACTEDHTAFFRELRTGT